MPSEERHTAIAAGTAYEKPAMKVIELVAEETLATGCKTFSGGPGKTMPTPLCGNALCSLSIGS